MQFRLCRYPLSYRSPYGVSKSSLALLPTAHRRGVKNDGSLPCAISTKPGLRNLQLAGSKCSAARRKSLFERLLILFASSLR